MKKSLLILSGGMDSVTLLYQYQKEIALAVTFDYGANHNKKEIECAKYHCKKLNIRQIIIKLPFVKQYFKSSLLSNPNDIPNVFEDNDKTTTVVPFRNGVMLSIACGIAESNGLNKILIANQIGGISVCSYPDCSTEFIKHISNAMYLGTYCNVLVESPYNTLEKSKILDIGTKLNIDYQKTYSCYKGQEKHCGVCGACVKRKEAFKKANLKDPTTYEK